MKPMILSIFCFMISSNILAEEVRANGSSSEASPSPEKPSAVTQATQELLQQAFANGKYRETSKNKGCPPGEFQWIENNSQLQIGDATPTFITITPQTHRKETVAGTQYIFETETSVNTQKNVNVREKYTATTIENGKTEKQVIVYNLGINLLPSAQNPKKKTISLTVKEGKKIIKCNYEK